MLDVHVLTLPTTNKQFVQECLASVTVAANAAGFPVSVHVVDGIDGHLGISRARGYAAGNSPYVTHVDDDDFVQPGAFAALLEPMQAGATTIYTKEWRLMPDGRLLDGYSKHHLAAYRRDLIADLDLRFYNFEADAWIGRQMRAAGETVLIDEPLYIWRQHESNCMRLRKAAIRRKQNVG